ncbi:MAG TPA: SH3 domain-containing protein, partial [Candidatus Pelethenecus sp.]|nr:SH3 domain-containing protein [Candidatus Pelethenecus sp.]
MKKILFVISAAVTLFGINMIPSAEAATSTSMAGIVEADGSNLNVRASNSTSSTIIGKAKDKSYLTILSQKGSWYYVEYLENTYGYVHGDY